MNIPKNVLIDEDDIAYLESFGKWAVNSRGYVAINKCINRKQHYIFMHRLLLGLEKGDGLIGDHINGNPLDNRRSNLRIVNATQNCMNTAPSPKSKYPVKGIYQVKRNGLLTNRWISQIKVKRVNIRLGYFKSLEEAVEARRTAERKYFGEYAYSNRHALS